MIPRSNAKEIRPRSKKRAVGERAYKKLRDKYLTEHAICEVAHCGCWASEIHHKKGRIGDLLTDTKYFLAVCRSHHLYIELHPEDAKKHGYSLSRLAK